MWGMSTAVSPAPFCYSLVFEGIGTSVPPPLEVVSEDAWSDSVSSPCWNFASGSLRTLMVPCERPVKILYLVSLIIV
jgi:hypothetical protein